MSYTAARGRPRSADSQMDKGLKQRLVGATVLVAAGVLFIPMFLDGPHAVRTVTREVELPVPAAKETQTLAITDERPGPSEAEPARERAPPVAKPSTDPPQKKPLTVPKQKETRAPAGSDTLSAWAVQVGSFAKLENAEKLAADLKGSGYPAFVARHSAAGRTMFRVRVGPEKDKTRAQSLAKRLARDGQATAVLRHP